MLISTKMFALQVTIASKVNNAVSNTASTGKHKFKAEQMETSSCVIPLKDALNIPRTTLTSLALDLQVSSSSFYSGSLVSAFALLAATGAEGLHSKWEEISMAILTTSQQMAQQNYSFHV